MKSIKAITKVLIFLTGLLISSNILFAQKVKGDGNIVKQERPIESFSKLQIDGVFKIYLSQGDKESVFVETDSNIQDFIRVVNDGEKLKVDWKDENQLKSLEGAIIYITLRQVDELKINGIGKLECKTPLNLETLDLNISGVGSNELDLNCTDLNAVLSVVGNVELEGTANNADISISGIGSLEAYRFVTQQLNIVSSGIGSVEVTAEKKISINSSGIGGLRYKGNPEVIKLNASGIGSVTKM